MNNKTIYLIVFFLFCNFFSFGQYRIILTNGKSFNSNLVDIEKRTVKLDVDGQTQSVSKDEILCVIPNRKKAFTFLKKNDKKIKISKKDIYYDYEGTDLARLYGYKYFQTSFNVEQIYTLNPNINLSREN